MILVLVYAKCSPSSEFIIKFKIYRNTFSRVEYSVHVMYLLGPPMVEVVGVMENSQSEMARSKTWPDSKNSTGDGRSVVS
ncbi:hypothetical protein V1477_004290 [Vespula maculifrons]|uniref:Uncharacterized protein n=1 Tax=Vespula maculifrons TaxID=7453 RepID=A0ABD2CR59_VESMC